MSSQDHLDFDSLWDYSDPHQTEIRFRAILLQVPEDNLAYLELLTQIARAQGLQHKFDRAHQTLDQVERRLGKYASRAKVRYLLERGRALNSSGNQDAARPLFEQALDMAKDLSEDFYAVDALHMLAIVAPPDSSLDLNLRAIQMAESSTQAKARSWLASLYNNTGWSYHERGEYESALEMFEKAEAARRAQGRVNEIRIAQWCVARALRSLNRVEEALSKQRALHAEFEEEGEDDGFVYEEIAECLLALNRGQEARPYFAMAHKLLSQDSWLAEKEPERLARLKELSQP
ncbi:MAG TPA: tetratricopeptide repeat protein [Anaerolineales bacterium]|nr:tetratricopeptide repeat protein [Anaerolineales bacterium]